MAITMYGDDGKAFEKDLLLRDVKGIEANWFEQFNNSPDIRIMVDPDNDFPYFRAGGQMDGVGVVLYDALPVGGGRYIFYSPHPMGWVKYFAHSGNPKVNEGGFGGSPFGVMDRTGAQYVLRGPWSSRAAVVNMAVNEEEHRTVMDVSVRGRYYTAAAMKTAAIKFLAEHFNFPYYIIRPASQTTYRGGIEQEKPAWTVSLRPDAFEKPGGKAYYNEECYSREIETLYSPKGE